MKRATVYKALFYNDLCQQLLGGFVSYVTLLGHFDQN